MKNGSAVAAFEKAQKARDRAKAWRLANPERARIANVEYRKKNAERIREQRRTYREINAEAIREKKAADYLANREIERAKRKQRRNPAAEVERAKRWAKANHERHLAAKRTWQRRNKAAILVKVHRRNAIKASAPGRGISATDWQTCLSDSLGLCAYCNERKPLTMDHIEALSVGGAHDPDNIAAACIDCNTSKSARPLIVWLARKAA